MSLLRKYKLNELGIEIDQESKTNLGLFFLYLNNLILEEQQEIFYFFDAEDNEVLKYYNNRKILCVKTKIRHKLFKIEPEYYIELVKCIVIKNYKLEICFVHHY